MSFIYFDIKNFSRIENEYGGEICNNILSSITRELLEEKRRLGALGQKIEVVYGGGDDFIVVLFSKFIIEKELQLLCQNIKENIIRGVNNLSYPLIEFHCSFTQLKANEQEDFEHFIYRELKALTRKAKDQQYQVFVQKRNKVSEIMTNKAIYPVYQPIISLQSGKVFGREALVRGEPYLQMSPYQLFELARETGMLLKFERMVRETVIRGGVKRPKGEKLFINITPEIINELNFRRGETHRFLREYNFTPEDIVFEITENHAITDFKLFRRVVEHYRSQGYKIAVDDAGAGFSTLQVIAELCPDFIKIDMSLIRDLDKIPVKYGLVEALVNFSNKTEAKLIAEGIETIGELESILNLGIEYGQGYFIAKPGEIAKSIERHALKIVSEYNQTRKKTTQTKSSQLRDIIELNHTVNANDSVKDVVDIFSNHSGNQGVVVLDSVAQPVGLVMKDRLYYKLGSAYGVSLYMRRPITQLMDKFPLIVDIDTDLHSVIKTAMERDLGKLYDFIIVTQAGRYYGTISMKSILKRICQMEEGTLVLAE